MSADWLIKAIGPRVAHITARSNLDGIERLGLLPPVALARRAGVSPGSLVLRDHRVVIESDGVNATLNHQRPILHGLVAARTILDGDTPESWARRLDERVFFWPERRMARFAKSLASDLESVVIWLDTRALMDCCGGRLAASPINSGNFRQGGAKTARGDWLFVPVLKGADAFRLNRKRRGLVKTRDAVAELSVEGGISAADLAAIRCP